MTHRVPLWLASFAVAVVGVMPVVASAQETPPNIVVIDDATPGASANQPAPPAVPDHWIGVHFDGISDVIKTQLDIPNGVTVIEVIDKSPAQKAGLQKHDILITANGVAINGQD